MIMTPRRSRRRFATGFALLLLPACTAPAAVPPTSIAPAAQAVASPSTVPARSDGDFDLSVANIMRGERLVGRSPDEVRWSADSRHVYFRWREPQSADTATSTYRVAVAGGDPVAVPQDSVPASASEGGSWSADRSERAVVRRGDVWVVGRDGGERRITATAVPERQPHLSADAATVYFVAEGNLYAVAVAGGPLRQLTDFRDEEHPEEEAPTGQDEFLREEQERLFGSVRERTEAERRREELEEARRVVPPTYLGASSRLTEALVSPSGRFALVGVSTTVEPRSTMVAAFVTESGYTEDVVARAKVGDEQESDRAAVVELATGELTWIEPEPLERDLSFQPVGWAPAEDRALLLAFSTDHKDRWILSATPDGLTTALDHLHDEAWVGGPGLYTAGWLPAGDRVYFVSERTGFAHLYTVGGGGGQARALTSGSWEVTDVELSPETAHFVITTSEAHPGERHLYAIPFGSDDRHRLTALDGWSTGTLSPDGRTLAMVHSRPDRPPELYLQALPDGEARRVTHSTTAEFERGPWIEPAIVQVPASDGALVPARVYRPRDLGAEANGAAVIFVHGAGYLQNVHRGWSSYYREYMFHHLLASLGYVVLDMDYRGSAGYGRDWRTAIYRRMGGRDLADQVDGARWLVRNEGVDSTRVGIYGGSYGGFLTLMGMFTEAGVFRSGAALRAVTDWAHYNHGYTSRILNRPQDDPEAYRRSSPIYFAEGLRGDLLIAHGMLDVNVHFQDVVRLAQRLIELGKRDWELAVYPVEDHAFVHPESWTDEYRRVLGLFEETLRE